MVCSYRLYANTCYVVDLIYTYVAISYKYAHYSYSIILMAPIQEQHVQLQDLVLAK